MRFAVVCNEEFFHSPQIEKIVDHFTDHPDHHLEIMARNNLHHRELKGVGIYFVLGGDGTLFTLTHYLKKGFIVGIHTGLENSVGHFMGLSLATERFTGKNCLQEKMEAILENTASDEDFVERSFSIYHRLKGRINKATGITVPIDMAFNEYALGNNLFGRPSKYALSILSDSSIPSPMEWQRSSGVICSTLQGMSGWSKNILNEEQNEMFMENYNKMENSKFFYLVREPMHRIEYRIGFTTRLTLISDMAGGIMAHDGFNEVPFDRNDEVVVEGSPYPLKLFRKDVDFTEIL